MVNRATKNLVMAFGTLLAIAGMEHGLGEMVQGDTSTNGIIIRSWGDSELFRILAGEPAMTIVPNFLVSGVLSALIAGLILVWCLFFLAKNHSGLVLLLLSVVLLLVGGGFGPPLVGIIIGSAGMKLHSRFPLLRRMESKPVLRVFSGIWPYPLWVGIACYLYLFPVSIVLWGVFGLYHPYWIMTASFLSFVMLFVSILSAYSHDAFHPQERAPHPAG